MVRKLVRTLLSLSLVSPLTALGLGLGDINLHSALNEELEAEIELLSAEPGDVASIKAGLASYEDFARLGIERTSNLMLLQFAVETRPDGQPFVKVSSVRPIREPFLDFLLELNWRKGRLMREYTLLLDPPELVKDKAPATRAPVTAAAPAPVQATTTAPATLTQSGRSQAPVAGGNGENLVYGPIKADDTLWSISTRLRPDDSVSIKQMMMALYRANPHAFLDNNINKLRKGAVLRLDDLGLIHQLSQADAAREVELHSRRWSDTRQALGGEGAGRKQSDAPVATPSSVGAPKEPRLKLVAPEGDAKAKTAGAGSKDDLGAVRQELMLALEAAEAQRRENAELQERLRELESQLASVQRLLTLQSPDLAQLQQQLGEQANAGETAEQPKAPAEPAEAVKPAAPAETPAAPEVEPKEQPAAVAEAKPAEKPVEQAPVKETKAEPKVPPKSETKPKPPVKRPPVVEPEPVSFLDELLGNWMMLGGIGFGLILLILGGMIVRRKMNGGGFQESILSGGTSSMLSPKEGDGSSSSSLETSLISDLADDGMGGMPAQESEVDPITEAEVYMAYGRHQQAEELLRDAIEQEPERHELLGKLMEIYYKTKNRQAFEEQAGAAHAATEGQGAVWERIAVMGHELAPENPLFADAPEQASAAIEDDDPSVAIDDVLDIGLDLDALAAEMEPSDEFGADATDDLGIDLGLDLDDAVEEEAQAGDSEPAETGASSGDEMEGLGDLDFGLDSAAEEPSGESDTDSLAGLDFGLDSSAEEQQSGESDTDDLGNLDFGLDTHAEAEQPDDSDISGLDGLDFGIDSEGEAPAAADDAGESGLAGGLDFVSDTSEADSTPSDAEVSTEAAGEESGLAFDMSEFSLPEEDAGAAEPELDEGHVGALDESENEVEAMDFGMEMEDLTEAPAESAEQEEVLDFGLDTAESDAATKSTNLDDFGLDLGDFDVDGADFGDGLDEIGTKLDLATAYVEMGDADGAREMLEEVMSGGDESQKQKAQQLMQQIAAQA